MVESIAFIDSTTLKYNRLVSAHLRRKQSPQSLAQWRLVSHLHKTIANSMLIKTTFFVSVHFAWFFFLFVDWNLSNWRVRRIECCASHRPIGLIFGQFSLFERPSTSFSVTILLFAFAAGNNFNWAIHCEMGVRPFGSWQRLFTNMIRMRRIRSPIAANRWRWQSHRRKSKWRYDTQKEKQIQ